MNWYGKISSRNIQLPTKNWNGSKIDISSELMNVSAKIIQYWQDYLDEKTTNPLIEYKPKNFSVKFLNDYSRNNEEVNIYPVPKSIKYKGYPAVYKNINGMKIIYILMEHLQEEGIVKAYSGREIANNIKLLYQYILHEFAHAIDEKGNDETINYKNKNLDTDSIPGSQYQYFNSDTEFDAYCKQMSEEIKNKAKINFDDIWNKFKTMNIENFLINIGLTGYIKAVMQWRKYSIDRIRKLQQRIYNELMLIKEIIVKNKGTQNADKN